MTRRPVSAFGRILAGNLVDEARAIAPPAPEWAVGICQCCSQEFGYRIGVDSFAICDVCAHNARMDEEAEAQRREASNEAHELGSRHYNGDAPPWADEREEAE